MAHLFIFWMLGFLTLIGALSTRSFYDYLYQFLIPPISGLGDMPRHGGPRRFGCAIGAAHFMLGGTGFHLHRPLLALIPPLVIVSLGFGAAFTQWCFASALYRLPIGKDENCC